MRNMSPWSWAAFMERVYVPTLPMTQLQRCDRFNCSIEFYKDILLYVMVKSVDYSDEQLNFAPERQRDGGEEKVGVQEL